MPCHFPNSARVRSSLRWRWPELWRSLVAVLALGCVAAAPAHGRLRHPHRAVRAGHAHVVRPVRSRRVEVGRASYYHPRRVGRVTASGAPAAAMSGRMTAASRTLPLGTTAKVTNEANGRSVRVKVTDRGPYVRSRILDVSPKAARVLGMTHKGVSTVKVRPIVEPSRRSRK